MKADAGHVQVEKYLSEAGFSSGAAFFRPQYITGKYNNKDCEEWFFDSECAQTHLISRLDARKQSGIFGSSQRWIHDARRRLLRASEDDVESGTFHMSLRGCIVCFQDDCLMTEVLPTIGSPVRLAYLPCYTGWRRQGRSPETLRPDAFID